MVTKTFRKTITRTFQNNYSRALILCFIVLLGVSFTSGLGTLSSSLTDSLNDYYEETNGLDFIIKSPSPLGFQKEEINQIRQNPKFSEIMEITSIDQSDMRVIEFDWNQKNIHQMEITNGRKISSSNEILVDQTIDIEVGTKVKVWNKEYNVVGKVKNPSYYFDLEKEISMLEEELNFIYYLDINYISNPQENITTDLYIKWKLEKRNIFSSSYQEEMKTIKQELAEEYPNFIILSLNENMSYKATENYGKKITVIAAIFPLFFLAITCLVIYSTMKRLIKEERSIIACYRSLGISKFAITLKYFFFSFIPCLIGAILGFLGGIHFLPTIIYPAFQSVFYMPEMTTTREITPGITVAILMLLFLSMITVQIVRKTLKEKPSDLLKPKSPKPGKKILLEYLPWLWKHFSFKYKSATRNIFRYKTNLIMTLLSVAGTTALTFASFGLYSVATSKETVEIPSNMADTFATISSVIILFAAALCILVILNITNMNIEERKKEIASLRVLGYHKKEVRLYIEREINITSILGIMLGLPMGYALLDFLFHYLEFGNIKNVLWFYYGITILLVLIFVHLSEIVLRNKINRIDMNSSLKSNE